MKRYWLWAAAAVAALGLAACDSVPPPAAQDSPLKTVRRDAYFAVVRFMDEGSLKAKYPRVNPFISFERKLTPTRFMVFKLNWEEVKRPIVLRIEDMQFRLSSVNGAPVAIFQLKSYWEVVDDQIADRSSGDKIERERLIDSEMMPNEIKIPAGGRYSGLVVFSANYPAMGDGQLTIQVLDENKQPLRPDRAAIQVLIGDAADPSRAASQRDSRPR